MENWNKFILSESSLSRVMEHIQAHDCAVITAFRNDPTDVSSCADKEDAQTMQEEEGAYKNNLKRNRDLKAALLSSGYGVTKVKGTYVENFMEDNAVEVKEDSLFVVNRSDDQGFIDNVTNLGKKFFGTKFGPEAVKVALLHDVLEDTPYTPEQLAKKGFSDEVIEAVQLLTKNKALSYADNISNIINSGNPLAMMVKYCDNYMNYTGDKSHWTAERAAASQKKYLASLNGEEMVNEKAGDVYSARQAEIIKDLGNDYFLGDDSYDDDDGFTKTGYSVYKQVGDDSYRMVGSVDMSPYSNPPGHVQNEIKKLISSDQNVAENTDYLEEK